MIGATPWGLIKLLPFVAAPLLFVWLASELVVEFQFAPAAVVYLLLSADLALCALVASRNKLPIWFLTLWILFTGLPLLFCDPVLSDDIYRYVWEGVVQNRGYNPYDTPPNHPAFDRETLNKRVAFPDIPAIYPPLSQLLFRAVSAISVSLPAMKAAFLACLAGLLVVMARNRSVFGDSAVPIVAFVPLMLIETAWSGHLDIVGVLFLAAALVYMYADKGIQSGILLALSVSVKIIPIIFVPLFIFHFSKKRRLPFLAGLLLIPLLYLPFADAGSWLFFAFKNYSQHWAFNGSFYRAALLAGASPMDARVILGVLFALWALYLFVYRRNSEDRFFLLYFGLAAVSPVVWPWYLLWLVPLGAKHFPKTTVMFTWSSFFTYQVMEGWIEDRTFMEFRTYRILEYGLTYSAFLYEFIRRRAK
ncbi:MAG: DUF2029 domain-containing protein [Chitinivibrionales bacterium]|nr:DUF2029 domain-containing protein [Chitinivibrionales bacterium]MBD3355513.1 DUF2029 domain-containing protein [Chitinivibrionales bacterium]